MTNLSNLIKTTWSICRLQGSPQDMPYSLSLMLGATLAHWALGFCLLLFGIDVGEAFLETTLFTSLIIVYAYVVLYWKKNLARYPQTLTALMLSSIFLNLFGAPLIALQSVIFQEGLLEAARVVIAFFYLSFMLALNIWMLVVMTYIYKKALEVEWLAAMFVTFGYLLINFLLLSVVMNA